MRKVVVAVLGLVLSGTLAFAPPAAARAVWTMHQAAGRFSRITAVDDHAMHELDLLFDERPHLDTTWEARFSYVARKQDEMIELLNDSRWPAEVALRVRNFRVAKQAEAHDWQTDANIMANHLFTGVSQRSFRRLLHHTFLANDRSLRHENACRLAFGLHVRRS